MKEDKNEPAFPTIYQDWNEHEERVFITESGMSKRFFAACMAMQGILSSDDMDANFLYSFEKEIIEKSYKFADELLKQENDIKD